MGVLTTLAAARLLAAATSLDTLAPLGAALGFGAPLPIDRRTARQLAGLTELARTVAQHAGQREDARRDSETTNGEPSSAPRPRLIALLLLEPEEPVSARDAIRPRRATPASAPARALPTTDPGIAAIR